ncbi:MAG: hypothetical protein U0234_17480 [Sandaracinus sp.]
MISKARTSLVAALLSLGCAGMISLADAGVDAQHDAAHAGWSRLRSLRYGVSLVLPGTPRVVEEVDDARLRREGVILVLELDPELRRRYEVRLFRSAREEDAQHVLDAWGEEMFARARGVLTSEEHVEVSGHPALDVRYDQVGPRHEDELWVLVATDGRSVVEIAGQNLEIEDEQARPPQLEVIRESISFGR